MAMFQIYALDEQIKALPTVDTASGSIASFDTDLTENLVEVKCQIVATQSGSGTPSPSNPRPITTYTSLNLSHSGSDTSNPNVTNIPFGQTVAQGTLNVTTGVLEITHIGATFNNYTWGYYGGDVPYWFLNDLQNVVKKPAVNTEVMDIFSECFEAQSSRDIAGGYASTGIGIHTNGAIRLVYPNMPTVMEDLMAEIGSNKFFYPLATPIDIQLDSITLQALLNENNVWCDTGDTEVKFLLTVGKKIG